MIGTNPPLAPQQLRWLRRVHHGEWFCTLAMAAAAVEARFDYARGLLHVGLALLSLAFIWALRGAMREVWLSEIYPEHKKIVHVGAGLVGAVLAVHFLRA